MRRANGLVRVLGAFFALVEAALVVLLAVLLFNLFLGHVHALFRDPGGVGSHVSYQSDLAAPDLDALIKRLGDLHGEFGIEVVSPEGRALESRSDERRHRVAREFGLLDGLDGMVLGVLQSFIDLLRLGFVLYSSALKLSREDLLSYLVISLNEPVRHGLEIGYFPFPFDDQADGRALDAADREILFAHVEGGFRAEQVADQPVNGSPRLLGVHSLQVYGRGILERVVYFRRRNGVEHDAVDPLGMRKNAVNVLRNGLSFPIRVGCQIYLARFAGGLLQVADDVALAAQRFQGDFEAILHVDSETRLGHLHDVADRRFYHILVADDLVDGLDLGRRLNDYKSAICHKTP